MTRVDWIALGLVALTGLLGLRKGLVASALAITGVVAGAVLGARAAPLVLSDGNHSPYAPLVALGGAVIGAAVLEALGSVAGTFFRAGLRFPPLRAFDTAGGLVLGAAAGLALVWVFGAAALLLPGQRSLRESVQRSSVLRRLNEIVPPEKLLSALARVDPFPSIAGPAIPTEPPTQAVLDNPVVRAAAPSVVRVLGTACGLGISGSGWVAAPGVVVTAAHVVAGEEKTYVVQTAGVQLPATAIAFDSRNDVAVLRVPGLAARPLPLGDPQEGASVAIVGYPLNGPLDSEAGRVGRTARVLTDDAYGNGPVHRTVTSVAGEIRHGNSGGPAIDAQGRVQLTIFAARTDSDAGGGYGIPSTVVRQVLQTARAQVSTGPCAP
ncbi:MAG TPA: MarP family serine protease [Gaiellaceae bacterium]|nr:MarP family serine protease [Gaiellaceae bacterium]